MIYLAADHRGYELKEEIKRWLKSWRRDFEDLGNFKPEAEDDFPDWGKKVAKRISQDGQRAKPQGALGIVVCGSGVGMDIVANRYPGVRCGLGFNPHQVRLAKRDDDINCLSLPAEFLEEKDARTIVQMFLETEFNRGEKYLRRIKKIEK